MKSATWLLLRSHARAVPGLPMLMAIGMTCGGWSMLAADPAMTRALALAAALFAAIAPALFAGAHVRELGARYSLLALPGFARAVLAASLAWLAALSLLCATLLLTVVALPVPVAVASCFAAISALFWFGFLPGLPRFLSACVLIAGLFAVQPGVSLSMPAARFWALMLSVAAGWVVFSAWLSRRLAAMQVFPRSRGRALHLPLGLSLRRTERIGTPEGTLLLGMGDAFRDRVLRGVVGLWLIPGLLLLALWMGGLAPERLVRPAIWCLGLGYAFGWFMHLCQAAAQRRRQWWLRVDGSQAAQLRRAQALLRREWWGWGALLLPVIALAVSLQGRAAAPLACFLAAWWAALLLQTVVQSSYPGSIRLLSLFTLAQWLALLAAVAIEHVEGDMRPLAAVAAAQWLFAVVLHLPARRAAQG